MKRISTNNMTFRYLFALGLMVLLSVTSYYIIQEDISSTKTNAAVINVSGRQRMLSQRIALKAHHLAMNHSKEKLLRLRQEFIEAINTLEKSHGALIKGNQSMNLPGRPSPEVEAMFFSPPVLLDSQITKYLSEAKAFSGSALSELTEDNPHLHYLTEKSNNLLVAIDALVRQYQKESEADVEKLHHLETWILIVSLFVLAGIGLFIFRPMVRRIQEETEKLERAEERARTIMEMVADGIIILNEKGIIESFNRSAEQSFGYTASQVIGENIRILLPEPYHSQYNINIASHLKKTNFKLPVFAHEFIGRRKDGSIIPLALSVSETKIENQRLFIGSMQDITERKKMEEKLKAVAVTDELTGLFNRRGFLTFSEKYSKLAERTGKKMSLIYLDLDNMKSINDELGHETGDQALVDFAGILKKSFRDSDILARLGGDEFAVLLTEHAEPGIEEITTANIEKNIGAFNKQPGRNYKLSVSIGFAHHDSDRPCSIRDLLTRADASMYEDKRGKLSGRD